LAEDKQEGTGIERRPPAEDSSQPVMGHCIPLTECDNLVTLNTEFLPDCTAKKMGNGAFWQGKQALCSTCAPILAALLLLHLLLYNVLLGIRRGLGEACRHLGLQEN